MVMTTINPTGLDVIQDTPSSNDDANATLRNLEMARAGECGWLESLGYRVRKMNKALFVSLTIGLLVSCSSPQDGFESQDDSDGGVTGVSFRQDDERVDVLLDGKPLTTFHYEERWDKPFLHPIRTASGIVISRGWPVDGSESTYADHKWHRGFWYGHGDINGEDFWREKGRDQTGTIVLTSKPELSTKNEGGTLAVDLGMKTPKGDILGSLREEFTFWKDDDNIFMDTVIEIRADKGLALTFGDTDDGGFGMRLSGPFRQENGAVLINAEGLRDTENIWGKSSRWIDYSATVEGKQASVAILDHPTNLRHPTGWHARGYSLASANPFAERSFTHDDTKDGSYTIPSGESVTFRYRVVIHEGETTPDDTEKFFRDFATGS